MHAAGHGFQIPGPDGGDVFGEQRFKTARTSGEKFFHEILE
jgi:hypothetical protein